MAQLESPLSAADERILGDLGERLADSGLALLLRCYRDVGSRTGVLQFDRTFLPTHVGGLLDLLCLGAPVARAQALADLGEPALALLIRLGLVRAQAGFVSARNLRLVDHFGALIFVGIPGPLNELYFGQDSAALGNVLLGAARGRTLDICCGSGAQAILCAMQGAQVVGLERNAEAIRIGRINAALNRVSHRMRFVETDVLEVLAAPSDSVAALVEGPFDTICCNPPLLPVPGGEAFPVVGDGGEDALRFTTGILRALDRLLTPTGRLYMIGAILGSEEAPQVDGLREIALSRGLRVRMIVPAKQSLRRDQPLRHALELTSVSFGSASSGLDHDLVRVSDAWEEMIAQGDHLFSFYLMARRAHDQAPGLDVSPHYARNEAFWYV